MDTWWSEFQILAFRARRKKRRKRKKYIDVYGRYK